MMIHLTKAFLVGIFVLTSTPGGFAQSEKTEACKQTSALRDALIKEAKDQQFNVRLREIVGDLHFSARKLFMRIAPIFNEGDIFSRANYERAIASLSKVRELRRITDENTEIRLLPATKQIDIIFCVEERRKK